MERYPAQVDLNTRQRGRLAVTDEATLLAKPERVMGASHAGPDW